MIKNYRRRDNRPQYIINDRIQAPGLRLIDDKGRQIGVFDRIEALNLAREKELDLVLIASGANPPVAKLIDFKKFLYQEGKRRQEAKKGAKKSQVKDIKLSLFIDDKDKERLAKKTFEFLEKGHQVRVSLLLKGREVSKREMAFELLNQFTNMIAEGVVSTQPKVQGRIVMIVISKKK